MFRFAPFWLEMAAEQKCYEQSQNAMNFDKESVALTQHSSYNLSAGGETITFKGNVGKFIFVRPHIIMCVILLYPQASESTSTLTRATHARSLVCAYSHKHKKHTLHQCTANTNTAHTQHKRQRIVLCMRLFIHLKCHTAMSG